MALVLALVIAASPVRGDDPATKNGAQPNTVPEEKQPSGNTGAKKDANAKPDDKPADVEKVDAKTIFRKLNARTDIKADKTPLNEVVAQLSKRHGIPIKLDEAALKKAGVTLNVPITASIKNFTLSAALNQILKDLKLHHGVKDGVLLITAGDEPVRVDEEEAEVVNPPVRVLAPRIVRAAPAVPVPVMFDAAAPLADVAAMEKQFTRKFRAALRNELGFVESVCEPTKEQMDQIREVLEKYRADQVKKYTGVQKRPGGNRAGRNGPVQIGAFPDPRKMVRDSVARTVKTNLSGEQVARFEGEIEKRNADRSRAAIHNLVALMDKDLTLSGEQREKLTQSLSANLNATWLQQFEMLLQQGSLVVPSNIPPKLVESILNATQKTIWRRTQANNNQGNQVMIQGGFGVGIGFVDIMGDDDGMPDEADDADADEEQSPADAAQKVEDQKE